MRKGQMHRHRLRQAGIRWAELCWSRSDHTATTSLTAPLCVAEWEELVSLSWRFPEEESRAAFTAEVAAHTANI